MTKPCVNLDAVLRISDRSKFWNELVDLAVPPGASHIPLEERSEIPRGITILSGLYFYVGNEGLWKYLVEEGSGPHFREAQRWLKRIKAQRTSEYCRRAEAAFPGNFLDDDYRINCILEEGGVDNALRELDREYKDSLEEMTEIFRGYIQKHQEKFEAELVKHATASAKLKDHPVLAATAAPLDSILADVSDDPIKAFRRIATNSRVLIIRKNKNLTEAQLAMLLGIAEFKSRKLTELKKNLQKSDTEVGPYPKGMADALVKTLKAAKLSVSCRPLTPDEKAKSVEGLDKLL